MARLRSRLERAFRAAAALPPPDWTPAERRDRLLALLEKIEFRRDEDCRQRGDPVPPTLLPKLRELSPPELFEACRTMMTRGTAP